MLFERIKIKFKKLLDWIKHTSFSLILLIIVYCAIGIVYVVFSWYETGRLDTILKWIKDKLN